MNIAHEQIQISKTMGKNQNTHINLSDSIPVPKPLSQVLRSCPFIREKWGLSIKKEILRLFDNVVALINLRPPYVSEASNYKSTRLHTRFYLITKKRK